MHITLDPDEPVYIRHPDGSTKVCITYHPPDMLPPEKGGPMPLLGEIVIQVFDPHPDPIKAVEGGREGMTVYLYDEPEEDTHGDPR